MENYFFQEAYNRYKFLNFLRKDFLPDDFVQDEEAIEFATKTAYSKSAVKLGVCKSLDLVVYEITHTGKEDPRVGLSKEAFRMLAEEWQDRALVIFVADGKPQNYRFSLIEVKLEGNENSNRIERKYSNPRRYSYLLGEGIGGHTPNEYLFNKGKIRERKEGNKNLSAWEDLLSRFSVEILTKAFYAELSDWYAWAIDTVTFPGEQTIDDKEKRNEHRSKNVIRLLTRLLFVWFLKQKKLIPDEIFDEDYLKNNLLKDFYPNLQIGLFREKSKDSVYYKAILQNLFFATLNCPIVPQSAEDKRERGFRKSDWYGQGFGSDYLMRYESLFSDPTKFLELVNECVPFLNGGLFDCLDDKQNKIYIDGFSDNLPKTNLLIVPDYLFFGETAGKGKDLSGYFNDNTKKNVDVLGLLDILKKYNFTIEENTPFDQEVSLDPELLGKVFENLLASYNPETKTTARKQTGSFYTPREIVQYMVDESLVAHLKRTVGDEYEEEYRKLMRYTDEPTALNDEQKRNIIQSLQNCKVLDPACGSGAFPVGVLQHMVHILSQIDPKNETWKDLILENSIRELGTTLKDCTPEERDEIQDDINRNFDDSINRPDYARKLYLIENCIYGVDIQPIAIQISKLRFFISLVVDQKPTTDATTNFGIRPLPNLEAKFVAANTLIGLNKEKNLFDNREIDKLQAKLTQASHRIFGAKSNKSKNRWKERVMELQTKIAEQLEVLSVVSPEDVKLMREWRMFDQNASSPFFDPEWMFGVSDGFDIVIGNPPYLKEGRASKSVFDGVRESKYYQGKMDLWYMFACCGIDFLNMNGVLCFIATNNWVTNSGASIMRNKVVSDSKILQLCDFSNFMIFESASIQTMVMLFEKDNKSDDYAVDYRRLKGDTILSDVVALLAKTNTPKVEYLTPAFNRKSFEKKYITFSSNEAILDKIVNVKNVIFLTDSEVAQGIVPNPDIVNSRNIQKIPAEKIRQYNINVGNGVFVLPKGYFSNPNASELRYIKPLYEPIDMSKYRLGNSNRDIIYITKGNYRGDAHRIISHLEKFREIMEDRRENQDGRICYYHLHWPRTEIFFEQGEKILVPRKCSCPCFVYTSLESYVMMSINVIKTDRVDMKYLTGLLNSKLVKFWLKNRGKMQGLNYQLDKEPLVAIPIAIPSQEVQTKIATLVDYIIWLKAHPDTAINDYVDNDYVSAVIEDIIDALIFEIYFPSEFTDKSVNINSLIDNHKDVLEFYNVIKAETSKLLNQIKLMKVELKDMIMPILSL